MCFSSKSCSQADLTEQHDVDCNSNQASIDLLTDSSSSSSSVVQDQPRKLMSDFSELKKTEQTCSSILFDTPNSMCCHSMTGPSQSSEDESSLVVNSIFTFDADHVDNYEHSERKTRLPTLEENVNSPSSSSCSPDVIVPMNSEEISKSQVEINKISSNIKEDSHQSDLLHRRSDNIVLGNVSGSNPTSSACPALSPSSPDLQEEEEERLFDESPKLVSRTKRLAIKRKSIRSDQANQSNVSMTSSEATRSRDVTHRSNSLRSEVSSITMRRNSPRYMCFRLV